MSYGTTPGARPAGAITLSPGMDVQAAVNSASTGATFWFAPGVYRLQSITPKDNQVFVGAEGAVLNGSKLLTSFTREAPNRWVATGQAQEGVRVATDEADPHFAGGRAGYPDTVYIDDVPQTPVDTLAKLGPGKFYFDYVADRIYLGSDPTGKTVEAGVAAQAFKGTATGVTVTDLTIEKYATPAQHGAIQGGRNWTIADNEVRLNYGVGIDALDGSRITGNYVHDNGQMGLAGGGRDLLVEGNEIARNGFWSGIDVFWEGGGSKFTETVGLIVRANYSHHNHGFGLWTDIDNLGALYVGNVVAYNDGGGINHEISGAAVIRDNSFVGNGSHAQGDPTGTRGSGGNWLWGAAIQIQNSKDVEVYGNRIDMTGAAGGNGIALIQQDRGSGAIGAYKTTNNDVHDNIIVSRDGNGITGGAADFDEDGLLDGGNSFDRNTYYMTGAFHWWWGDFPSGDDWAAYMRDTDQDEHSVLHAPTAAPDTSAWAIAPSALPPSSPPPSSPPPSAPPPLSPPPSSPPPSPPAPPVPSGRSIQGGASAETLRGTIGSDRVLGNAGNDTILGLAGDDTLSGGDGKDRLQGDAGADLLSGGKGADVFVFARGAGIDRIGDFEASGRNQDVIEIARALFPNFTAVQAAARDVGADVWIQVGSDILILEDVRRSQLSASDFAFF